MLDSLKEVGRNVGREINRAWETVAEGWRELVSRSGNALTHFSRRSAAEGGGEASDGRAAGGLPASSPRWGLLAGEVEETDKELVVRVEVPGLEKEDCRISIEGNVLYLSGEKRFERESGDSTYHVTERAYGMFQIAINGSLLPDVTSFSGLARGWIASLKHVTPRKCRSNRRSDPLIANGNEHAEHDHHGEHRQAPRQQPCVKARHDENGQVFIEVLYGDRVTGAHQHVAAVLQQGIHRHHEETGAGADQDQQRHGQPQVADQNHQRHQQAHRDAQRNHAHRSAQRDAARGHDGADGDADRDHALKFGCLRQSHAECAVGPVDHDELQRRTGAPEKRGDGE
jgi:HSP20 family protein